MWTIHPEQIQKYLGEKYAALGDNACQASKGVLTPYHTREINGSVGEAPKRTFNVKHSSRRVYAEHGINFMKQ